MAKLPMKPPKPFAWLSTARRRAEARAHGSPYRADVAAYGSPYRADVVARGSNYLADVAAYGSPLAALLLKALGGKR